MSNNVKVNAKTQTKKAKPHTHTHTKKQPQNKNNNHIKETATPGHWFTITVHLLVNITELVFTWQAISLFPTGKRRYINSRDGY